MLVIGLGFGLEGGAAAVRRGRGGSRNGRGRGVEKRGKIGGRFLRGLWRGVHGANCSAIRGRSQGGSGGLREVFGPSGPNDFTIISPPRLYIVPSPSLSFSLYRSFIVKRVGAIGSANKNGGFVVGPVLGPHWVRGFFVGSACRTMAGFC